MRAAPYLLSILDEASLHSDLWLVSPPSRAAYFEFQAAVHELGTQLDTSCLRSSCTGAHGAEQLGNGGGDEDSGMDPDSMLLVKLALLACNDPKVAATQAKLQVLGSCDGFVDGVGVVG